MTETTQTTDAPTKDLGLFSRAIGLLVSPGETMKAVVATPRWLGTLGLMLIVTALTMGWFMSTPVGRQASLDKAEEGMKMVSAFMPEQAKEKMAEQQEATRRTYLEGSVLRVAGLPIATTVVAWPIAGLIYSLIILVLFNVAMGGAARFKQIYAVVIASWMPYVVAAIVLTPLNYFRESLDSATTLRIFVPMLDDGNFLAQLLGGIDLFRVWSLVTLSIGLGVLYKRKTSNAATVVFGVYAVLVLVAATIGALIASRAA